MKLKNLPFEDHLGLGYGKSHLLSFHVTAARITYSFGHLGYERRAGNRPDHCISRELYMNILLDTDGFYPNVYLGEDGGLKYVDGRCSIRPRPEAFGSDVPVGSIHYTPAFDSFTSSYFVAVFVPEFQYQDLVRTFNNGMLPSSLALHIRGLSLSDSESLQWNTKETPELPVILFEASFGITAPLGKKAEAAEAARLASEIFERTEGKKQ